MKEIWKDIKDYEGLYKVSNLGRVKSLISWVPYTQKYTKKEKILKHRIEKSGYYCYCLTKNKVHKNYKEHRLVAEAFVPNPYNYPCINHKDENPQNNNAENLEWCTYKYNNNYGNHILNIKKANAMFKKQPIIQYDINYNIVKKWDSIKQASLFTNINMGNISQCCRKLQKTAGGYIWRYE